MQHPASRGSVALWAKWSNLAAALKIVFKGHLEPNLTVRFEAYFTALAVVSFAFKREGVHSRFSFPTPPPADGLPVTLLALVQVVLPLGWQLPQDAEHLLEHKNKRVKDIALLELNFCLPGSLQVFRKLYRSPF